MLLEVLFDNALSFRMVTVLHAVFIVWVLVRAIGFSPQARMCPSGAAGDLYAFTVCCAHNYIVIDAGVFITSPWNGIKGF